MANVGEYYTDTPFVNGVTPLSQDNMNNINDGINGIQTAGVLQNGTNIGENKTLASGKNYMLVAPITVDSGSTLVVNGRLKLIMSELSVDTIAGSGGTTVTIKSGHTLTLVENLDAGSNKLTNVTDPTAAQDAATKNYVDTQLLTLDTIGELTDVTITSVADNEVLAYDSSSGHFINQTASEAGLLHLVI